MEILDESTGRSVSDKNNCTVRALSHCLNIPEFKAYNIVKSSGRKDREGWYSHRVIEEANKLDDFMFIEINLKEPITIGKFRKSNPVGIFYVSVNAHALAIVNGSYKEGFRRNKMKICRVWRCVEL